MTNVELELKNLKLQEAKLLNKLKLEKANKTFKCGCSKLHKIKDCVAIQTHWYEAPYGCIGGSEWWQGEVQIICPETDHKNRLLFDSQYKIPWDKRSHYDYNAESQFKRVYMDLFKEVIQDYKKDKRSWWNNYYIDKHHAKFGINIPGITEVKDEKN